MSVAGTAVDPDIMPLDLLEFEQPLGGLLKNIEELGLLAHTPERDVEIAELRARLTSIRRDVYAHLTPWQRVLVARHPARPNTLDYVARLFENFTELHGDRLFADDHAIVCGLADYRGAPVLVLGHQKGGGDTKEKIYRNFGYAKPEGYRKAIRVMRLAEKFRRPIVVFVDTPAAYPGIESEERGVAEAIARNLRDIALLEVPIVVIIIGEGGSGGALGLAIGDRILMQEYAVYSVIPPEGCAAILWRDVDRKVEAAAALKISANDLQRFSVIDEIVREPDGAAHTDPAAAAASVDEALSRALEEVSGGSSERRLERRYDKFRQMGNLGIVDQTPDPGKE